LIIALVTIVEDGERLKFLVEGLVPIQVADAQA